MKRPIYVPVAVLVLAGAPAYTALASGEVAPIFGIEVPPQ
jgi:hypothetical protein